MILGVLAAGFGLTVGLGSDLSLGGGELEERKVLMIVGPDHHPPESHEALLSGRLLAYCLEKADNLKGFQAEVVEGWPEEKVFEGVNTIVFLGDLFPPEQLPNRESNMAQLEKLMAKGVGIACIHYATGVLGGNTQDGDHPLLRWTGGYFANPGSEHHESVARIFEAARIEPGAPGHPVSRGWSAFTVRDEPYIKNYFGTEGNQPGVHVFATSLLPPEDPKRETVAWGRERSDGGRGFMVVMPHFYRNWAVEDLRRLVLNGIVWSAGGEVPEEGVRGKLPEWFDAGDD